MSEKEDYICSECSVKYSGTPTKFNGEDWCKTCSSEKLLTCSDCDSLVHVDSAHLVEGGNHVCENCSEEDYCSCQICGLIIKNDDASEIDGDNWCARCVRQRSFCCDDCETLASNDNRYYRGSGGSVCVSCYENNYFCCEDCGDIYHNDEYHDGSYCGNCFERDGRSSLVHDYGADPLNYVRFQGKPKDKIYYGIELEVNVKEGFSLDGEAHRTMELLGSDFVMLKEDGSINFGFEICTAPATIAIHHKRWEKFLDNVPNINSWSSGQCGIHVHISRQGLSQLDIGKIVVFVNDPENIEFIKTIAGRYSNSYCEIKNKTISSECQSRYEAVNTTGDETIEIRIFRGTLNKVHFYADLEFCESLVKFVKTHGIKQLNKELFIKYIDRKIHPNLYEFLVQKDFIQRRLKANVPDNQQPER